MWRIPRLLLIGAVVVLSVAGVASADATQTVEPGDPGDAEGTTLKWQPGPVKVMLGHGVQLDLPASYQFLGQPQAGEVMTKLGNLYNDNLLGIVVAAEGDSNYLVTMRYDEEGFIKDDEELDAEEILSSIREGEEEYNEERKKAGFPPIHADSWQETPRYDKANHQVIWGLLLTTPEDRTINYNTRVLGRKGYVSVNLVTVPESLAADKPAATAILSGTQFVSGSRYQDFDKSSDKVAEYGLTGLVLGGAGIGVAKLAKVGLLAKFGKVILAALIAGKKAIIGVLILAAAAARKLFGKTKQA